jgi:hypothetical protein
MGRPPGSKPKTPAEQAKANPKNVKLAIAAFCYRCMGGGDGNNSASIKAAVRDCPTTDCKLWPFRGYQNITTKSKQYSFPIKDKPI